MRNADDMQLEQIWGQKVYRKSKVNVGFIGGFGQAPNHAAPDATIACEGTLYMKEGRRHLPCVSCCQAQRPFSWKGTWTILRNIPQPKSLGETSTQ